MISIYPGIQRKKKKPLRRFKIKILSVSNTLLALFTSLFTSLGLGDCQTLPSNCYCICEAVLISQRLQVLFGWPFLFPFRLVLAWPFFSTYNCF